MTVDVSRIPGRCKCGRHFYSTERKAWVVVVNCVPIRKHVRKLPGPPPCANPPLLEGDPP